MAGALRLAFLLLLLLLVVVSGLLFAVRVAGLQLLHHGLQIWTAVGRSGAGCEINIVSNGM
jgi:hypothetical protein